MSLEERVEALVRHYLGLLGLGDWDVSFSFGDYSDGYAGVEPLWYYSQARFSFDIDALREKMGASDNPDAFLDELACHEAVHCALSPLAEAAEALADERGKGTRSIVDNLHEKATDTLSRAPLWELLDKPKG